ncbi:Phosphodiest-domain-containing protein [Macrolepiota fuliginosa MF-IS2]|uniref:Phosphodiest-domain-containing protein n=1 Tax=Macrolepiota fuliginosa MF-IS2 TaxID=1400762 RepID=A0A9P5XQV3_9AGAR|nr:Phosphodiest-domain-containing protein [Macrolepiota fuliginosa MF-IS2]
MAGNNTLPAHSERKHDPVLDSDEVEERKGLLSEDYNQKPEPDAQPNAWSRRKIIVTASVLLGLLVTGAFSRSLLIPSPPLHPNLAFHGSSLRSNGTHDFRRTVLLVSIDGLRADYLDRGFTPHLLDISKQGLRAKSMRPVFPTLTFPNHWALMTGLYAESHGIVANNFWDPVSQTEFHYNKAESCYLSRWWFGEPMWETAMKAGMLTANLMWPGPIKTTSGATPTYMIPWRDHVPLDEKLDQILQWIDLPLEERPQLITAYEPSLDQVGHKYGPLSAQVNSTLKYVDTFAKHLHTQLKARNLTDIVDIAFVSDHGMVDTTSYTLVNIDEILGKDGMQAIEHEDGWPAMGIRFREGTNESLYLERLYKGVEEHSDKFDVFTHETMPRRWHFSNNKRIAPIYVVPKVNHVLTTQEQGTKYMSKGNHGFDNAETAMQAMFVAHGPFSAVVKSLHQSKKRSKRALSWANQGWHSTSDDTYVMNTFANVEVYNLVMKLLGIEDRAANTNGTVGFWDVYF